MDTLGLLTEILGTPQKHGAHEYYFMCPFCSHYKPKLAVNITRGQWHCWVCDASGRKIYTLLKKLDCTPQQLKEARELANDYVPTIQEEKTSARLVLPPEYHPLTVLNHTISYKNALRYVLNRGLTASDIMRYHIGYCATGEYADRIIIPSYDANRRLNYFVGRKFLFDDGLKYLNPRVSKDVIVFESDINYDYPLVLCEGVFDAIAIRTNAIPLLGKTLPNSLREKILEKGVKKIYLALDSTPDTIKSTAKLANEFMKNGIEVYRVMLPDKDPSVIGFAGMQELIQNTTTPMTFQDLIRLRV